MNPAKSQRLNISASIGFLNRYKIFSFSLFKPIITFVHTFVHTCKLLMYVTAYVTCVISNTSTYNVASGGIIMPVIPCTYLPVKPWPSKLCTYSVEKCSSVSSVSTNFFSTRVELSGLLKKRIKIRPYRPYLVCCKFKNFAPVYFLK